MDRYLQEANVKLQEIKLTVETDLKYQNQRVDEAVEKLVQFDQNFASEMDKTKHQNRVTLEKLGNIVGNNSKQMEVMIEQTHKNEHFMQEVLDKIKKHELEMQAFIKGSFNAERNLDLLQMEIRQQMKDAQNQYLFFKEGTQADIQNILSIQKETNRKLEGFAEANSERAKILQNTIEERLAGFQETIDHFNEPVRNEEEVVKQTQENERKLREFQ